MSPTEWAARTEAQGKAGDRLHSGLGFPAEGPGPARIVRDLGESGPVERGGEVGRKSVCGGDIHWGADMCHRNIDE